MSITILIILITAFISWRAFSDPQLRAQLMFLPTAVKERGEYYRFITHGFVHGDFNHLLFNMWALYIFGDAAEAIFSRFLFGATYGKLAYLLFYLVAIVASSYPDYLRHRDNRGYASLGASGGVAALLWPFVLFDPWNWFIFPPLPAILLAVGYIFYSSYKDRVGGDNIGHNAHLWGAIFGLVVYVSLITFQNVPPDEVGLLERFIVLLGEPRGPSF